MRSGKASCAVEGLWIAYPGRDRGSREQAVAVISDCNRLGLRV